MRLLFGLCILLVPAFASDGSVTRYCSTNPNSTGEAAVIDCEGSLDLSSGDFALTASALPTNFGQFVAGTVAWEIPFGNGFSCINPMGAWYRFGPVLFAGDGTVRAEMPPGHPFLPGETWHFQYWYRDPVEGFGFNLSDAISVTFAD